MLPFFYVKISLCWIISNFIFLKVLDEKNNINVL